MLLDSRFGALWWMRVLLGVSVCGLMLGAARRSGGLPSSRVLWLGAGLGVLLSLGVSLGGHAAAARWSAPLAVGVDVLHLMAAALWLGGLVVLTVLLPPIAGADPVLRSGVLRALVPRTSRTAFASVLVLVASGVVSAWEESGSLEALAATAYGQTLLIKIGLLVPLLAIAAVNRFGIVRSLTSVDRPEDARLPRRLARQVGAEVGLGGAVLLAAATLTTLPPPGFQGVPGPVALARQAGDLRIALTVDPAWVGVSRFELTVTDAQGRPPSDVSDVILTFTMEGMNMGRTTVRATPRALGVFEAEGFYIGMPGASLVGAAVSRAGAAEQSAVFRIEMPNVSQAQFQGLAPSLGLGRPYPGSATTLDEAGLARGQANYAAHCATCHGDTGLGNGPAAASLLPPPADLTLHARWHSDAQLLWFITNGVSGTPMPGFADQLGPTERAEIVAHLHALALAPTASPPREAPVAASVPALATPATPVTSAGVSQTLSGRLVFGPDTDKDFWIWQFPGETAERLTQFGRLDFASRPVWSPDGQRIAFSFYTLPRVGAIPPGTDVYVMDADGRNMRLAAAHDTQGAALLHPVWGPDGAALYATHQARAAGGGTASRIERVDTLSGTLQAIVSNAAYPSPSHDGRLLAYVAMPNADGSAQSLWLSTADGHESRQIVPTAAFVRLSSVQFAPDGQRILFAAVGQGVASGWPLSRAGHPLGLLDLLLGVRTVHANGEEWDLWTVEPDGRNLRRLTNIAEDLPVATWSPSGRQIAFLGGGSARTAETGLAVIDADGGNLRRLTTRPGHRGADWSRVP